MMTFQLDRIHCEGCAKKITKAIQEAQPNARVEINIPARTVKVGGTSDRSKVAMAIKGAGYTIEAAA
ncbi:MAG: hypothetical protein A3J29_02170 [Acidobacteria bacterium RIFCSPLOWO2_12_FULL_67_14b]|nr:MAG: hypothetical protein A3J29_02170 [Acidobacteria bacterium RIFCSPLOWO2_12_FULL_67_14b]